MKRKGQIGVLVLALSFVLSGCGDAPYTLTPEEEATIVTYAAHVVSKFNTRQPDGLSHVPESIYQKETKGEDEEVLSTEQNTEEADDTQESAGADSSDTQQGDAVTESASLSEALGVEGISATYTGVEAKNSYVEPDYYALDATDGNTFLILHIDLKNETGEDIDCDLLSQKLKMQLTVNDSVCSVARTTILLNDLGTYRETIAAGQTVETLLFFEVPEENAGTTEGLKLKIEKSGASKEVVL